MLEKMNGETFSELGEEFPILEKQLSEDGEAFPFNGEEFPQVRIELPMNGE